MGQFTGKRLVIFGCGYVGAAVARRALEEGMRVTALTRNEAKAVVLRAEGVATVAADLADHAWHGAIAGGAEFALNCVSSGGGGPAARRHSYVEGMASVLAWARRHPAGALVYTGSTSVYPQTGGAGVDETASTEGGGERAQVLRDAESLLLDPGEAAAARRVVLRLAGIYGPGRHQLLDRLRRGVTELPGDGTARLNLIHRDDIVTAIFAVLARPAEGLFNVADGHPAARETIARWLAEKLGRAPPRFTGGATVRRAGEDAARDRVIRNDRLRAQLGWRPRYADFRAGYEAILAGD